MNGLNLLKKLSITLINKTEEGTNFNLTELL